MNALVSRPFAIVTGASSGIGHELACECVRHGFDLLIAADRPLDAAAQDFKALGANVDTVQADLATPEGVGKLCGRAAGRQVDVLIANAGHGLGGAFLDQSFEDITHVIDTNITGTLALIHQIGSDMRARRTGRIMLVGSIAGFQPGAFQAVYNGSKAFIDSFSWALRNELKDSGVTVTCLMPGVTDTEFFERAGMLDTKIGADENKMDPAEVAQIGFKAMMDGEGDAVAGLKSKIQSSIATVTAKQ
jgi:short-subunit dehydrogenase